MDSDDSLGRGRGPARGTCPAGTQQQAQQANHASVTCSWQGCVPLCPQTALPRAVVVLQTEQLSQQLIRLWSWQHAARHTRLKTAAVAVRPMGLPNTTAAAGDAVLAAADARRIKGDGLCKQTSSYMQCAFTTPRPQHTGNLIQAKPSAAQRQFQAPHIAALGSTYNQLKRPLHHPPQASASHVVISRSAGNSICCCTYHRPEGGRRPEHTQTHPTFR